MEDKTKEVVSAEQYRKDSLYGSLYDSTHFDVTDTVDIMLEEYAVMRVEQSTKHLQDRIVELEKALRESIDELKVFKGDIRTQEVINNGITALNTKS